MASRLKRARDRGLIKCPSFVAGGCQYEVITGSYAYGSSNDNSDMDIYGFCMPPKEVVFPHINGHIKGFDTQVQGFDQFQKHHVIDKEAKKEYDFTIFSIVKFFRLCLDCNPNMIDTLFVPQNCVIHKTKIGDMVRENRKLFLSKKAFHTFKGYAFSQKNKMEIKNPKEGSKRWELHQKFGFDTKFASHIIRLLSECEQILTEGQLDLRRVSEQLIAIREGFWSKEQVLGYFTTKELELEKLYSDSKLPYAPREKEVKELLMNCLEEWYGSLNGLVMRKSNIQSLKDDIEKVLERY